MQACLNVYLFIYYINLTPTELPLFLTLPESTSLYSITPEEGVYVVTAGDDWFMHVSAKTPYGCNAVYEVTKPNRGLKVETTLDGLDVELDTVEVSERKVCCHLVNMDTVEVIYK